MMELQAFHRVFAPSRRDPDRERFLVPSPPLWVYLDLRRVSISSELKILFAQHVGDFAVGAGVALASTGK